MSDIITPNSGNPWWSLGDITHDAETNEFTFERRPDATPPDPPRNWKVRYVTGVDEAGEPIVVTAAITAATAQLILEEFQRDSTGMSCVLFGPPPDEEQTADAPPNGVIP